MPVNIKTLVANYPKTIVVTDDNVYRLYGHLFEGFDVIIIGNGEVSKTLDTVNFVYQRLLELSADRTTFLLGVGGGVVLDITGFTASTFMRGLKFGLVPTTLLAQADAAYGGKNGFNFGGFKNLIGLIRQPEFIHSDFEFLKTLDQEQINCGFVEIIKGALIADKDFFDYLFQNREKLLNLDKEAVSFAIEKAVKIKKTIVLRDEFETGERRCLNFGHTMGHALESLSDNLISHGNAVTEGIMFSVRASNHFGYIKADEVAKIEELFWLYKIGGKLKKYSTDQIMACVFSDKKKTDDKIHFVFLEGIGKAVVKPISFREMRGLLDDLR